MSERHEIGRQLTDLSLSYGRALVSKQTGFLHFCHEKQEEEAHLSIPVVENFLFALALFRSRMVEQVTEGKELLQKLLHFQNRVEGMEGEGNFPVYLHEYPVCKDRFTAVHISFIILSLLKQFSAVLPALLKEELEQAVKRALTHAWTFAEVKLPPPSVAIKLAAASIAMQEILQDKSFHERGQRLIEQLLSTQSAELNSCPAALGSLLCSLSLISATPLSDQFCSFSLGMWHQELCCYAGPAFREWQTESEPQVTLYDLFLSTVSGKLSARAMKRTPVHLESVLIPTTNQEMPVEVYPKMVSGKLEEVPWHVYRTQRMGYALFENNSLSLNPIWEKGFHPFKIIWGSPERIHSFVCQKGSCTPTIQIRDPFNIDFIFELNLPEASDEKEKNREIIFFLDAGEEQEFLVAGKRSSTFHIGETVSLSSAQMRLTLDFFLEEGEGKFLGHRMLGNRPSQLEAKGARRFHAYDWMIFLRTVQRTQKCRIRVALKIESK